MIFLGHNGPSFSLLFSWMLSVSVKLFEDPECTSHTRTFKVALVEAFMELMYPTWGSTDTEIGGERWFNEERRERQVDVTN